ncbi:MAG: hypothetical protein KGK08_10380 [Acidobacteriota bacterium]|nr:hypothetical protein [Acidobacteriota bacterium]
MTRHVARHTALLLAGLALHGLATHAWAQQKSTPSAGQITPGEPQITFTFDREGLPVPHFVLVIHRDGTGTYAADEVERRSADSALQQATQHHVERSLALSPATTDTIFQMAERAKYFHLECQSKAKVADTGRKVLSYASSAETGSCTYHFSENKDVAALGDLLQGLAATMDIGRKLEFEHRFDHLGLDAEMQSLARQLQEKQVYDVGTIAPVLSSIVQDDTLIQRVRVLAGRLLEQAAATR